MNSLKMKLSVIYGVMQMSLGIMMKGLNSIYFRKTVDFIWEVLPQITFLLCLFGFMDLLIVLKWLTDWTGNEGAAPSIITQMINMFLNFGAVNGTPLIGDAAYQQSLQNWLVLTLILCVPLMLFVKPVY